MSTVQAAVIGALKASAAMRDVFGDPVRVFDADTEVPFFPYVRLERHESVPSDASLSRGETHTLQVAVMSRRSGLAGAREALNAVKGALAEAEWAVAGQQVVLAHVTYADTMRAPGRDTWRGLVRLKMITEEMGE